MNDVRREAHQILLAIDASRHQRQRLEDNWRRLWQLLREVNAAAYLPADGISGPWHLISTNTLTPTLAADSFVVIIWPPEASRSGAFLPQLLNWASVPAPHGR